MFKSSLLFAAFLFTILLVSDKFTQISAKPSGNVGLCTGKCNNIDRDDVCCRVSTDRNDRTITCCKKSVGCDEFNGGCNPEVARKNLFFN
uniref:Uncharacterized protein n=1 Tax=Meloidogyne enterolobii TaxID=390850 RepID=A0A6V7WE19_MELEN|nr:unnamed protein product [Meloidogyne enterolobii]